MKKRDMLLTIIGIIALFGLAFFVQEEMDSYIRRIVNLCLVYAIIGLSMNLTNGFVGQFSLGQAGFMAIGAYTVGIFTVPGGIPRKRFLCHADESGYCRY